MLECLNAIVVACTVIVAAAAADVVVVTTWQLHNLIWFYSFKLPVALSSLARSMRHAVTLKSLTQSSSQVKPRQNEIQSFIVIVVAWVDCLLINKRKENRGENMYCSKKRFIEKMFYAVAKFMLDAMRCDCKQCSQIHHCIVFQSTICNRFSALKFVPR